MPANAFYRGGTDGRTVLSDCNGLRQSGSGPEGTGAAKSGICPQGRVVPHACSNRSKEGVGGIQKGEAPRSSSWGRSTSRSNRAQEGRWAVTWLRLCEATVQVEVQGTNIVVVLRGTCFRAKYRKQEAPWLATDEFGPDDPEAAIALSEFRNLAWTAANETALRLGWIKSCSELHRAAGPH